MDFLKQKGPLARDFCNTLIYIISLVSLKPSSLQRVLTELQWNGMWFFSLAFFAVIFMEMLSDFLLVTDRCTAWKALNGNVSEAEFHNLQQIVLCENQKVSIEKKLASTILLVLMICATAAFVWFTKVASIKLFGMDMFNTTAECIIDSLMKKDKVICNEKDLQLGTEYIFPKSGVRLWRERAFHPKLLKDPLYMEEMQAVLEDEYQYQYFQMVTIID